MPDENEDIVAELTRLMHAEIIAEKEYVEELMAEEASKSSISKLLGSFSGLFKRRPAYNEAGEIPSEEAYIEPHLELKPLSLKRDELQKISATMEAKFK
ncbi:MAG: hypothetical protein AAFP70_16035 [Calditrichota bacterium]